MNWNCLLCFITVGPTMHKFNILYFVYQSNHTVFRKKYSGQDCSVFLIFLTQIIHQLCAIVGHTAIHASCYLPKHFFDLGHTRANDGRRPKKWPDYMLPLSYTIQSDNWLHDMLYACNFAWRIQKASEKIIALWFTRICFSIFRF